MVEKRDRRRELSEEAKMRALRRVVDDCAESLRNPGLDREEALDLIETTRRKALGLFPGKDEQFELIYRPRFMRIVEERFNKP